MKETSKLYKLMGGTKKSQRGYIARRYLAKFSQYELAEFEKQLPNLLPEAKSIKVNYRGKVTYI